MTCLFATTFVNTQIGCISCHAVNQYKDVIAALVMNKQVIKPTGCI